MIENSEALFKNYFTEASFDELLSPSMEVNPVWNSLMSNLSKIGKPGLLSRQNDINWHLGENGVTYSVYNDPQGLNRPWNLNVIPLIIHEDEWQTLEKGIKQRSEILNFILSDIYGKQELIQKGIIPLEIIYGHQGFLRQCDHINYNTNKHLLIHAVDMARGPDGQMWIINDRTEAPSGMGYALENRLAMRRVLPDLFKNMHVKKLSGFFQYFNELLMDSSPGKKDNPNIVVLTPGPHNETYFEHAYLASFLGYSLVQGNDLIVRDGNLWMKSLKGLKKVDIVLRRVDDIYTDPLELKEDSHLGVPGLLEVVRKQNVTIINPIGSRVLENPGLIPFIPAVAKYFLNEDLILPQIATWWCGQEKERKYVLEHLSDLIIKKIDRANHGNIFFGRTMSNAELDDLRRQISERPYRFVAQERISFSTAPTFVNQQLEPRNSVWRSYSIASKQQYCVMPGGLVRAAAERDDIIVSNQRGGDSKDIWIVGNHEEPDQPVSITNLNPALASGLDDLPSHTAENLYWTGRYISRTLITSRFIRMVLKNMTFLQSYERQPITKSLELLLQAITNLTATYPGFIDENENTLDDPYSELLSVILDKERTGSLFHTFLMFTNSYHALRNLWSPDTMRVFDSINKIWKSIQNEPEKNLGKLIQMLDQLISRIIGFMGLVEESILIEQGLLLYYIGFQLEQSLLNISKTRSLLIFKQQEQVEYEILESLLNSNESMGIYRYSYRSHLNIKNVINLILLDTKYPLSLAYQLNRLNKDLSVLPHSKNSHELTNYEKYIFNAFSKIKLVNTEALVGSSNECLMRTQLDALLSELADLLNNASLTITNIYFSHTDTLNQLVSYNLRG